MQNKIFLTVAQAEERYGISRWTLYLWASQGKLPSYKIGKLRRFAITDLDKYFEEFRMNPKDYR
jgi:excisionase family DNA binding protein